MCCPLLNNWCLIIKRKNTDRYRHNWEIQVYVHYLVVLTLTLSFLIILGNLVSITTVIFYHDSESVNPQMSPSKACTSAVFARELVVPPLLLSLPTKICYDFFWVGKIARSPWQLQYLLVSRFMWYMLLSFICLVLPTVHIGNSKEKRKKCKRKRKKVKKEKG
jgi:hypothetical protein